MAGVKCGDNTVVCSAGWQSSAALRDDVRAGDCSKATTPPETRARFFRLRHATVALLTVISGCRYTSARSCCWKDVDVKIGEEWFARTEQLHNIGGVGRSPVTTPSHRILPAASADYPVRRVACQLRAALRLSDVLIMTMWGFERPSGVNPSLSVMLTPSFRQANQSSANNEGWKQAATLKG